MRLIDFAQIEDGDAFLAKITEAAKVAKEAVEVASKIEKTVEDTVSDGTLPVKEASSAPIGKEDPGFSFSTIDNNGYPIPGGNVITLGGNEGSQLAIGHDSTGGLVISVRGRKKETNAWGNWFTIATVPYVDSRDSNLKSYVDKLINGLRKTADAKIDEIQKYTITKTIEMETRIVRDSSDQEDLVRAESARTDELLDKQYTKIISYINRKEESTNNYTDQKAEEANNYTDEQYKKLIRYIDKTGGELGDYADSNLADAKNYADKKEADANRYTDNRVAALVNSAPEVLDTLQELSDAIGNDPNFATTMTNLIGTKLDKNGGTITGDLSVGGDLSVDGTVKGTFKGNVTGDCSGNAGSSTKLKDTRTFSITDATKGHTGKTSDFDGTENTVLELPGTIDADITGNSATATKAMQDGNGNYIVSTYMPLSGGTITGNVNIKQKLAVDGHVKGSYFIGGMTVCETDGSTVKKEAPLPGFNLEKNAWVAVRFTKDNDAENPVLSINGSTAKSICVGGVPVKKKAIVAKRTYIFAYDGANFEMCGSASSGNGGSSAYGVCGSGANTVEKVVSCENFELETGAHITVKFTNGNTATNPTMNINSTGAKALIYQGAAIPPYALMEKTTYDFVYNGSQYEIIGALIWVQ